MLAGRLFAVFRGLDAGDPSVMISLAGGVARSPVGTKNDERATAEAHGPILEPEPEMGFREVEMNSDELKKTLGITDDGTYRIDPETGRVQREGFWGWSDTDTRVDPDTGKIQTEGFFGWSDTETRINNDSGVVQEESFFGYRDTETRIDPETGVIQRESFWGWVDTDERVDPETGKLQERGFFGWRDKS
jgi:hypothetical protein